MAGLGKWLRDTGWRGVAPSAGKETSASGSGPTSAWRTVAVDVSDSERARLKARSDHPIQKTDGKENLLETVGVNSHLKDNRFSIGRQ